MRKRQTEATVHTGSKQEQGAGPEWTTGLQHANVCRYHHQSHNVVGVNHKPSLPNLACTAAAIPPAADSKHGILAGQQAAAQFAK